MSVTEGEQLEMVFPPARRRQRRRSAFGYGWAVAMVFIATLLTHVIAHWWHIMSLAPLMAAVLILACFSGVGPTIVCGVIGSAAWMFFVAIDVTKFRSGQGIVWAWPDAPWRFAQFVAMAIFISGSYFARRRAEVMLRRAQQRLAVVLDESQIGTWHYEVDAGIFHLSPRMEAILRLGQGAELGYQTFLDSIPAQDRPGVIEAMTAALERRDGYEVGHRVARNDGTTRRIVMRGRPFVGKTGKVERLIGVGMDVTETDGAPASAVPAVVPAAP